MISTFRDHKLAYYLNYLLISIFLIITTGLSGCLHLESNKDILFQVSTIDALLLGIYDGEIPCGELKKHGDFGIGTFNGLDGEMIGFNGKFYQIKADGSGYAVNDSVKVPFAVVTYFEPDKKIRMDETLDYKQLGAYLDTMLPTKNIFYAIKITGLCDYIKTRSVPRQNKPYPPLTEVVKSQPVFEFHNVEGTIAGFWCPEYVKGLNVPGYHLHFITKDGKAGGHLLECRLQKVEIEIDNTANFYMALPGDNEFRRARLTKDDKSTELDKVEK